MVGAIVDNTLAKDWGGEGLIGLLGRDISELGVEDKVVALGAETDSELAADHGVGEDVAVLFPVLGVELEGVDTELDGGSEVGDPVGNLGRGILVDVDTLGDLGQDEDDGDTDGEGREDLCQVGRVGEVPGQGLQALDDLDNDGHLCFFFRRMRSEKMEQMRDEDGDDEESEEKEEKKKASSDNKRCAGSGNNWEIARNVRSWPQLRAKTSICTAFLRWHLDLREVCA